MEMVAETVPSGVGHSTIGEIGRTPSRIGGTAACKHKTHTHAHARTAQTRDV